MELVDKGAVFFKGGDCGRISPRKGDYYGGGFSTFLFAPEKLDISCY